MKRRETYRNTVSRNGSLTPHLFKTDADRIRKYCEINDISISKFVTDCMNKQLDILEREAYNNMLREMLIELLCAKKN